MVIIVEPQHALCGQDLRVGGSTPDPNSAGTIEDPINGASMRVIEDCLVDDIKLYKQRRLWVPKIFNIMPAEIDAE